MKRTWGDKDKDMLALNQIVQIPNTEMSRWVKQVDEWRYRDMPNEVREAFDEHRADHEFSVTPLLIIRDTAKGIMGALADAVVPDQNDIDVFNLLIQNRMHWEVLIETDGKPHMAWRPREVSDFGLEMDVITQLMNALQGPIERFHRCEECHFPFYAARSAQRYCSQRCINRQWTREKTREKRLLIIDTEKLDSRNLTRTPTYAKIASTNI